MATIKTTLVTLKYTCDQDYCPESRAGTTYIQPLSDVPQAGTLICPECGEDMELSEEVEIPLAEVQAGMTELKHIIGKDN